MNSAFDGGRLIKGRKRHIVVDTIGSLVFVGAYAANVLDGTAARKFISELFVRIHTVKKISADSAYSGVELLTLFAGKITTSTNGMLK